MKKELLLAISDDRAASYNLRFLREIFSSVCDLRLTLFYVTPQKASWVMDKQQFVPRGDSYDEFVKHSRTRGEQSVHDARQWLLETAGCLDANVAIKVIHSQKGTVRELIHEAHEGLYDALLLGRKTFTWFEELFSNSITHAMILSDIDFPIWVCKRPPDTPRHGVLLSMDGSDASLRMVDHAAYMLANEDKHTFTLFHVSPNSYDPEATNRIFAEGLAIMKEHDIDQSRIELKMVSGSNPVKAIMKEVADGSYSAVGVGKRGANADQEARGFFPSSVTVNLLRQMEDAALWISK